MLIKTFVSITVASFFVSGTLGAMVDSIDQCPPLTPRIPPTNVNDLRPDDIKVTGALGDSIMAGFGIKGITHGTVLHPSSLYEYRGLSYGGGGDDGAVTLPNFLKKYNPNVKGASKGYHLAELCYGPLCPPLQYRPHIDLLNAAQSGGMAMNLDHELNYLIRVMKLWPSVNYSKDWKMINIQIGSNDQCASCVDELVPLLRPELYGKHVEEAVDRIRTSIPKVIVNLIGTFNVSDIYSVTAGQDYCDTFKLSDFHINTVECPCALKESYREKMNEVSMGYNRELERIHLKFKSLQTDTFGVMYSPASVDLSSFPVHGLSNVDCFHPSTDGHQFFTKSIWNTLFTPYTRNQGAIYWDSNLQIYCPHDADRFNLD
ncbi:hypothetical protein BDB01DRAFT_840127 [Pilobolus umbonatus]|nr:hypothetical protein BDB01DRAFT_840127 [Pilobolus umbonatus]